MVAKTHCREKGNAAIVAGEKAMRAYLKNGVEVAEPGVRGFPSLEAAAHCFFQANDRCFTVTLRR